MAGAKTAVLLMNVGTPDSPSVADVRKYLREFLMDPYVVDLAYPLRWLLVHAIILPRRPRASAHAYEKIWTAEGSPLAIFHQKTREKLQKILGEEFDVAAGMCVGNPSLEAEMKRLAASAPERLILFPLFPQHAIATTGGALAAATKLARRYLPNASLAQVPAFHDSRGFIDAFAANVRETLQGFEADHVLFSFHGLPLRQVERDGGRYPAQCESTARAIAATLGLAPERWSISYQSRLGRAKWIEPYTEVVLGELARKGVRRLAVVSPAFVSDCLETLEELGIRGRESFRAAGGEELRLVPSLNASDAWVRAAADLVRMSK